MLYLLERLDGPVLLSALTNGVQLMQLDPETMLVHRVIEIDVTDGKLVVGRDEVVE